MKGLRQADSRIGCRSLQTLPDFWH